jgi:hypothetical protein
MVLCFALRFESRSDRMRFSAKYHPFIAILSPVLLTLLNDRTNEIFKFILPEPFELFCGFIRYLNAKSGILPYTEFCDPISTFHHNHCILDPFFSHALREKLRKKQNLYYFPTILGKEQTFFNLEDIRRPNLKILERENVRLKIARRLKKMKKNIHIL